jgi:hypothetical protein
MNELIGTDMKHRNAVTDELEALIRSSGIAGWTYSKEECANHRAVEEYERKREAHFHSNEYKAWTEQYSCPHTLVGSVYATPLDGGGNLNWSGIERFFDLLEWGGEPPHYAQSLRQSCHVHRSHIRVEWADRYELNDQSGRFIILPTAVIPEEGINNKLQAYRHQSQLPSRISLKEIDVMAYCRNFEKFAKPFHSYNESDDEWELRLVKMFVKIYEFAKSEENFNSIKLQPCG